MSAAPPPPASPGAPPGGGRSGALERPPPGEVSAKPAKGAEVHDAPSFQAATGASDGQMAVNSCSHQRSVLAGMQVCFPIEDAAMVIGARQTIYFAEFDGPLRREFVVHVLGD